MEDTAVFELFSRRLPPTRGFLMAAGLEQVLDCLEHLHFTSRNWNGWPIAGASVEISSITWSASGSWGMCMPCRRGQFSLRRNPSSA